MKAAFDRKLRRVCFRCSLNVLLEQLGLVLVLGGTAAALAVLTERALAVRFIEPRNLQVFLGAVVLAGGVLWFLKRPSRMKAALLLDERLATRERFSTAMLVAGSDDPFARAACREAHEAAERTDPKGQFPIKPSRRWGWAVAVWMVFGGVALFLPDLDLMGYGAQRTQQQEKEKQLAKVKAEVKERTQVLASMVKELGDAKLAADLAKLGDLEKSARPADVRREAIRKLGDLAERIKKMKEDARVRGAEELKSMLKRLRGSPKGLNNEINQALAKGDFKRAAELLRQLQKQLEEGKLSGADKDALAGQLRDLGKQLDDLAKQQKALEDELQQAGLDKKLAELDEEQLREALKKAGLTDEQIEQLMKKCKACQQACNMCGKLGEAMFGCGRGLLEGELVLGEMAGICDQLSDLEAMSQRLALVRASLDEIDDAIACLGACEGGNAGLRLQLRLSGPGAGGPAFGPRATGPEEAVSLKQTGVKNKAGEGPVIASWYFKGEQIKGESKRKLEDVVQAAKDRAAEAVSENRIPREHQPVVKKYFDEMEKSGE